MRNHATLLRTLGSACLSVLLLGPVGCAALKDAMKLDRPRANITGVHLQDIALKSATLLFDVAVENPYSVPLPLVNVDYGLASQNQPFLSGKADVQGAVPANGSKTISLPATVNYLELLTALKGVRPGDVVPYKATLGLSVNAPGIGALRLPMQKDGQLPVPTAPEVSVQQVQWDNLSLDHAGGKFTLGLVNRNRFPVDLSKLAYTLNLGGVDVASGSADKPLSLAAGDGAGALEIPISLSPQNLGLAAFRMLTGEGAGYTFRGDLKVGTPFGPMSLPVEKVGKTVFKR